MATTEVRLDPIARRDSARPVSASGVLPCAGLTALAISIHGYHAYAEDGGVYLAGIKRILHPELYPYFSGFVTAHLKFSLFAPAVAAAVHMTHLGLMSVLFAVYAGSIWLTLYSGWLLASRITTSASGRTGAVTLLALTLTIPVAGTSLMLMDPYVTARSISTPCGILMLVAVLDIESAWTEWGVIQWKAIGLLMVSVVIAAAMHPLMAAYSVGCAVLLVCASLPGARARWIASLAACGLAIVLAACVQWMGPAAPWDYATVAHSRTYWFLSNWQWYELVGLVGPLVVLALLWLRRDGDTALAGRRLALVAIMAGASATCVAGIFARLNSPSFEVARLQPLRIYQTIYFVMLLALGAFLGERVLKRNVIRWAAFVLALGGAMAFVQRETFPHSAHVELPWRTPANAWEQAFNWIRTHTPSNAVFALDANYTTATDDDSQNFRAIAERSVMPDRAKDGGIASIAPNLTAEWMAGEGAQKDLDLGVGAAEIARLRTYGVNWVVITRATPTSLSCAFANASVKVCALP